MDEEQKEELKREYELAFLVKEEDEAAGLISVLKDMGAEILLEGPVRKTALAYEIKKQDSAYFGFAQFMMEPEAAKSLEAALNMRPELLRFLLMTPPTSTAKPQEPGGPEKPVAKPYEPKTAPVLSNEALEKKIEEILQ